ncbi:uncharacterized protein LOC144148950 [Haemaphysalis longicornis]
MTGSNCTNCTAFADIRIKRVTKDTQRSDAILKRAIPLVLDCADGLCPLRSTPDTPAVFCDCFGGCLSSTVAFKLHWKELGAQEDGEGLLKPSMCPHTPCTTGSGWGRMLATVKTCLTHCPSCQRKHPALTVLQAFTADSSAAEKAALCAAWPQDIQLLCLFHVAPSNPQ